MPATGRISFFAAGILALLATAVMASDGPVDWRLEVVRRSDGLVLWDHPVRVGACFTLDYVHSSDHTPVHDLFAVGAGGELVLIEERFDWYGSGLEFHPTAEIRFCEEGTRVRLNRSFSFLALRVGQVAGQVLTVHQTRLPLLKVAKPMESVCLRIARPTDRNR